MTRVQAAWAAGLFDGEGSVGIYNGALQVRINMCCEETINRFYCLMRLGHVRVVQPKQPRHQKYWAYAVCGTKAEEVLRQILPYLVTKRQRVEVILVARAGSD